MKGFVIAASLALVLSAAPTFAQTPPAQKPTPTPAPAQAAPAPAPQPHAPFPQGAKIAFVNFQRVVAESVDGKASTARVNALIAKKQTEGTEKAKKLQADQQKLQTTGSVMSEAARAALEKDVERETVEGQRFQQDAQAEVQELQNELEADFIKRVTPILAQVAADKGLQILFNAQQAGFAWVDPGLDLTTDVIKKLDAASKPGGK